MAAKDLTSHTFGRLTVLGRSGTAGNGAAIWQCRCFCGVITEARTDALTSGSVRSCGCLRDEYVESRHVDRIGCTFGRLTVLRELPGTRPLKYVCRCTCGKEHVVDVSNLVNGNVRSCGCLADERKREKLLSDEVARRMETVAKRPRHDNKSGRTGVRFRKDRGKWVASITYLGKKRHLGTYADLRDAIAARENAEIEIFGHVLTD